MPGIQETQLYCLADRRYYETPDRLPDEDTRYPLDRAEPPTGWRRGTGGLWTALHPASAELPEQGWKIHVSTVPEEAGRTLADTARICLEQGVAFKFLRSTRALRLMSSKYMNRSGAGKFITLYPEDEPALLKLLDALGEALDGRSGPYILSDLRIGNAPVHVRYGAFAELWCRDADGGRVRAMRHPSGELVPDTRGVVFRIPEWVTVPERLRPISPPVPPPATTASRTWSPRRSSSPTRAASTWPSTAPPDSGWCCARPARTADSTPPGTTPSPGCTASTGP